jgi:hypothetical protein
MNMSWEEEFLRAYASFPVIVEDPIEYRMHYDDEGTITMLSHQNHPDSKQYLIVTKEIYDNYEKYYVNIKEKKVEKVVHNRGISVQLKKNDTGYAVVKNHAGLVVEPTENFGNIEYYAANN